MALETGRRQRRQTSHESKLWADGDFDGIIDIWEKRFLEKKYKLAAAGWVWLWLWGGRGREGRGRSRDAVQKRREPHGLLEARLRGWPGVHRGLAPAGHESNPIHFPAARLLAFPSNVLL